MAMHRSTSRFSIITCSSPLPNRTTRSTTTLPARIMGSSTKFDLKCYLLDRVVSGGPLNSPWGLAVAPRDYGSFAGDLLVGNFADGTINAYDLKSDSFKGTLLGPDG